jgi:hypothetical protein
MAKIPLYLKSTNKILILYLTGVRGYFYHAKTSTKGSWAKPITLLGTFFGFSWLIYKTKSEFHQRERPNFFLPKFVYNSRRDHYVYYE